MKYCLLATLSAMLLTSCAGVHVSKTYVATGARTPKSIYIRPFDVTSTEFKGRHRGGTGERPIRQSLAGREFAGILKEEMSKIAPAMVVEADEVPRIGWLVEGELEVVHAGSPTLRATVGHTGIGRSYVLIHVRIIDVALIGSQTVAGKDKSDAAAAVTTASSDGIIYAFTLRGGSNLSGRLGSIYAPGLGYATPFDYRNAAERVMLALSNDPLRYGVRSSPIPRY